MGCRRRTVPEDLDRVARSPQGALGVGRHEPGRGAWLCAGSEACFDRAIRRGALGRALRHPLTTDETAALRARLYGRRTSTTSSTEATTSTTTKR